VIRGDRIYDLCSNRRLRDVQLYFAKLFGCYIDQGGMPIDFQSFAKAIRNRTYHTELYLKFGVFAQNAVTTGIGMSAAIDPKTGIGLCAGWFYQLGRFAVCPIYASDSGPKWRNTDGAWHSKLGTGKIRIHDFEADLQAVKAAKSGKTQSPTSGRA